MVVYSIFLYDKDFNILRWGKTLTFGEALKKKAEFKHLIKANAIEGFTEIKRGEC